MDRARRRPAPPGASTDRHAAARRQVRLAWRGENASLARIVAMLDGNPTIRYFDKLDA
jgi:hypothetical protein